MFNYTYTIFIATFIILLAVLYEIYKQYLISKKIQFIEERYLTTSENQNNSQLLEKILNIGNFNSFKDIKKSLSKAGFYDNKFVIIYVSLFAITPLLSLFVSHYFLKHSEMSAINQNLSILGIAILIIYLFPKTLQILINKRKLNILKSLPDALDLMLISSQAGLGIDEILKKIAAMLKNSGPEISEEFNILLHELTFLTSRADAFQNLIDRVELDELKSVATALLQSEQYGTPVAKSLKSLAGEFRKQRLLKAEEKAAKLSTTLTLPLVIFILPVIFIVLLAPALTNMSNTWT